MSSEQATRADVARLYARAAFGATAADLERWTGKPYAELVDALVGVPDPVSRPPLPDDVKRSALQTLNNLDLAQRWWVERMRTTPYPLEERMTLFLHDHFATGFLPDLPDTTLMMRQNELLRRFALGNFRDLCVAITLDPAMLYWLDGNPNTSKAPNENYARELLELFTLGTIPQVYTEDDVREAARVLTGWVVDGLSRAPRFVAANHDTGDKVVLGRTISNRGDKEYIDLVDVALSHPVAARFLAYKLVLSFAYEPESKDILANPDPLVARVADVLYARGWNLKEAMRTLLLSDEFRYGDAARGRQVVRQPLEVVVHSAKVLGISADQSQTINLLNRMGQKPFQPPNVGGWPYGRAWLSTATTVARYDWAVTAFNAWRNVPAPARAALPAADNIAAWTAQMGLASLHPNTGAALGAYLWSRRGVAEPERQGGMFVLLASSPDWGVW